MPDFRDWSVAAVNLLKGVVYFDDAAVWSIVLRSQSALDGYFARIGLRLVIDETEGYAYLRQYGEDECPSDYSQLPKLMRRVSLGYCATLFAVLLRDELRRFDEQDLHNERCVVEVDVLWEQWKAFFPLQSDEVKYRRDFDAAKSRLIDLGYIRRFQDTPESYEVRRIIKARLAAGDLEGLRDQLAAAAAERNVDAREDAHG